LDKIGILKEFDKLGRIVIPKDLRDRYGFDGIVEIVATEEGVLLKSPEFFLTNRCDKK
jgi:bifunctional DNA-binding transcriptional regulator/antitoxin component of YhaV-PrlF toxin-antitoxin module